MNLSRGESSQSLSKIPTFLRRLAAAAGTIVLAATLAIPAAAQSQWKMLGPDGGDARSLAYDPSNPDRLFLGTSAGELFVTTNSGKTWSAFAHFGLRDDYVLDNISFDPAHPKTVYVAAWSVEEVNGDLFKSTDGGKTWNTVPGMKGKSIRAFAVSDKDPNILVVGALDGVFRSNDAGATWKKITPDNHPDLRNFESIAVDRNDPDVIYAGTWHLPWKTTDGGKTWHNIKNGVIDDSDVFSIIIDKTNPQTVYASACSGIYRSDNAGEQFRKIQGIPGSARRTRVLQQDPGVAPVVYAGTTEGLWKTVDGGKTFKRVSPPNFILNDVLVDPRNSNHVLIATDRGGVFVSEDGAQNFVASNTGFSHRQITSIVADNKAPGNLYVSVVNDKEFGGVFTSRDNGQSWSQMSDGLERRDVFDLKQASSGALVAATNRGLYKYSANAWHPINSIVVEKQRPTPKPTRVKGKLVAAKPLPPIVSKSTLNGLSRFVDVSGPRWFAATDQGILRSDNEGASWTTAKLQGDTLFVGVSQSGSTVAGVTPSKFAVSNDKGETWTWKTVPIYAGRVFTVLVDGSTVWIGTQGGALRSSDQGSTWEHVLDGLPPRNVMTIERGSEGTLLASAQGANSLFVTHDHGASWTQTSRANYALRRAVERNGRILAATAFNGLIAADVNAIKAKK